MLCAPSPFEPLGAVVSHGDMSHPQWPLVNIVTHSSVREKNKFVSGISCYLRHFLFCQDFCQHTHDAKKLCIGGFSKQMLILISL